MERFELENSREFKAAMELENALNNMCFDYKSLPETIKYFHPTLQQSLFRLIRRLSMFRQMTADIMMLETKPHMKQQNS